MKDEKLFEEICKIENTAKCNFVDDKESFTSEVLPYLKEVNPKLYNELIELYKKYYGENEKFWD